MTVTEKLKKKIIFVVMLDSTAQFQESKILFLYLLHFWSEILTRIGTLNEAQCKMMEIFRGCLQKWTQTQVKETFRHCFVGFFHLWDNMFRSLYLKFPCELQKLPSNLTFRIYYRDPNNKSAFLFHYTANKMPLRAKYFSLHSVFFLFYIIQFLFLMIKTQTKKGKVGRLVP
jgi:hypothetical protein